MASRLGRIVRGALAFRVSSPRANGSGASPDGGFANAKGLISLAIVVLAALTLGVALAGATAPLVTIEPASEITKTTAHVEGHVNPEGKSTEWRFEYITEAAYQHNVSESKPPFEGAATGPSGTTSATEAVEGELTGLISGDTYHLRLFAENEDGPAEEAAPNFNTALDPPTVTIEAPSLNSAQNGSYTFIGHVNPGAAGERAETSWHFDCSPSCGSPQGGTIAPDTSAHVVEAEVEGLEAKTTYTVTLHATNAAGQETTAEATFKTPAMPPFVASGTNTPTGEGEVTVRAYVTPRHSAFTACRIEYGTTAGYGESAPCSPEPPADAQAELVEFQLSGLNAGSRYHYRVVVETLGGRATTEDAVFETLEAPSEGGCPNEARREEQHATYLPDCRAYEQVSPPNKNGGDVLRDTQRTHVATNGNGYGFSSLQGFGDAHEVGVATQYLSLRSSAPEPGNNGWITHGISPPQDAFTFVNLLGAEEPLYAGPYSSDLESAVFSAHSPLTNDPNVAGVPNLYLRNDLHSTGIGHYQLLTACPRCSEPGEQPLAPITTGNTFGLRAALPFMVAASPDFGHILFESTRNLTSEAPPQPGLCSLYGSQDSEGFFALIKAFACGYRLYEWDHGTLRLAGMLPNNEPADASFAGQGAHNVYVTPHVISDGSDGHTHVFFTQPTNEAGETLSQASGFGAVFVNRSTEGNLFVRTDGSSTEQINVSERQSADQFYRAAFLDASSDGTRAFFKTKQALTEDAPANGSEKIYMWSATPDQHGHHLQLVSRDEEPADGADAALAEVGESEDGHYFYFMGEHEFLRGGPLTNSSEPIIYLWHDGRISRVGPINEDGGPREDWLGGHLYHFPYTEARVTPDGRHLLFDSYSGEGLTGYDHGYCQNVNFGHCRELYVYNADTAGLQCASCNPSGAPATAMPTDEVGVNLTGGSRVDIPDSRFMSDDGRHVFFSTGESLVSRDTNGAYDAYEYDTRTGKVSLLSSGLSERDSYVTNSDPQGRNVFFVTSQQLVGWDTDGSYDAYDARSGGGFPEPPQAPAPCQGDSCRPGVNAPPPSSTPGSATLSGTGNFHPHRRSKHRRRHRKHRSRNASHNGRSSR